MKHKIIPKRKWIYKWSAQEDNAIKDRNSVEELFEILKKFSKILAPDQNDTQVLL